MISGNFSLRLNPPVVGHKSAGTPSIGSSQTRFGASSGPDIKYFDAIHVLSFLMDEYFYPDEGEKSVKPLADILMHMTGLSQAEYYEQARDEAGHRALLDSVKNTLLLTFPVWPRLREQLDHTIRVQGDLQGLKEEMLRRFKLKYGERIALTRMRGALN